MNCDIKVINYRNDSKGNLNDNKLLKDKKYIYIYNDAGVANDKRYEINT